MPIVIDPSPPATAEGFILDPAGSNPLNLGNGGSLQLSELTLQLAPKRPEWVINADVDGSVLARKPFRDNRQCSFKVRAVVPNMDAGMNAIGALQQKLDLADDSAGGPVLGGAGLAFLWTPAHASVGLTGYILFAEIADIPITYDSGWFAQSPLITVNFTCKPFLYGSEVTGPTATGTAPLLTVDVPSVPGDVSAEARLVVTDNSSQPRRWVEWGLEQQHYNPSSPAPLLIDSEDLVTSGFAGTQATRTGGYRRSGATHDTVSAPLLTQTIAVCGTGNLSHIGTFRVKARVYAASTSQYWRLTWQSGDGPFTSNAWAQPLAAGDFSELDLGLVDVDVVQSGSQKWTGRIEAYTTTAGGETGEVDYLALFSVEGYGRLEAAYQYTPGIVTAFDDFNSGTAGVNLNAHTAVSGGSWATSGAATDFVFESAGSGGGTTIHLERNTGTDASYRFAILGSTTSADTEVGVDARVGTATRSTELDHLVIARWTDANNHVRLRLDASLSGSSLVAEQVVASAVTTLSSTPVSVSDDTWYKLRLIAYGSGHLFGALLDQNGTTLATVTALTSVLATGGTLATGKIGIGDKGIVAYEARRYDNFYAATPASEPLTINSGRSLEIRSDSNLRQSADGTTYGDIASRGSRLFIPPAGDANRTSRIAVRAAREDVATSASRNDGDSLTIQAFYTPRYLAVPR